MNRDECYILGKITKVQGYKGQVICFLDTDLPERYEKLESVLLEMGHELVPFFIDKISLKDNQRAIVKFADCDTEEEARELVNKSLWLPLSFLPDLGPDNYYFHEVLNFKVVDIPSNKELGKVVEVIDHPKNELFRVEDGEKEYLIPIKEPFISRVDKPQKTIFVSLPEGFIEVF